MVKIFVAVVGVGIIFSVDIDTSQTVHDLKKTIKAEDPTIFAQFGAGSLKLYLARDGGEWLSSTSADIKALKKREVPNLIKRLMHEDLELDPAAPMNDDAYFGNSTLGMKEIHVLVQVPDAPSDALSSRSASSSALIEEPLENPLLNEAATPYVQTAETLKDLDEVVELENAIEYVRGQSSDPFIVLESSSGMGKTQMAFNLMARGNLDVFYLVCEDIATESQRVYKAFDVQSAAFVRCVHEDMTVITSTVTADTAQIKALDGLHTFGFIHALLSGRKPKDTKEDRSKVMALLAARPKRVVFFLDEFPHLDGDHSNRSVIRLRFMRNVFRALSIPVILSSTNGTARNLVITSHHSRGAERPLWCVVLPQMPRFQDAWTPSLQPALLRYIVEHSRPLFARFALKYIVEHPFHGGNLCEYLDDMMFSLATSSRDWKTSSHVWFKVGQLCLFLCASYKSKRESGVIEKSKREDGVIDKHFARLQETTRFELRFFSGKLIKYPIDAGVTLGTAWQCQSVFPPVHDDVLLYMSLMGGRLHRAFEPDDGRDLSFATAFDDVAQTGFASGIKYRNDRQPSNDGMRFEALTVGAVVSASHHNGFSGIMASNFLSALLYELDVDETLRRDRVWMTEDLDFLVPFLAPPGQEWPQELLGSDLQLGHLQRELNKTGFDWSAMEGVLTGECKDYSKALDLGTMRKILMRVPSSSRLHVVVTNVLQESYFTKTSFDQFINDLSKTSDLSHTHFFRAGPGYEQEEFVGMTNRCRREACRPRGQCQVVDRVVVFIDIKTKRQRHFQDETMVDTSIDFAGGVDTGDDVEMSDS